MNDRPTARVWGTALRAAFVLVAAAAGYADEVATNAAPTSKWEKDIRAFEAADRTNPPPRDAILFIGSSSVRLWKTLAEDFPEHRVINRGFGGSQIADATHFADRIVIPCKPQMIVLHAGNNDLHAGKTPAQVFDDFKAFVARVRAALPEVRIAFMSINPSLARWSETDRQREANRMIREYVAAGKNMDYIDIYDAFLGPDGTPKPEIFVADRLHQNAEGYKIRAALTRPHLPPPSNPAPGGYPAP